MYFFLCWNLIVIRQVQRTCPSQVIPDITVPVIGHHQRMTQRLPINKLSDQLDSFGLVGRLDCNLLTLMFLIDKITDFAAETSRGLETCHAILNQWWALDAFWQAIVHKVWGCTVVAGHFIRTENATLLFGTGATKTGDRIFEVSIETWNTCGFVQAIRTSLHNWRAGRTTLTHRIKNKRWPTLNTLNHPTTIHPTLPTPTNQILA